MPECWETFCESGIQGVDLQRLVDELHPDCICERCVCSPYSGGPVESSENIVFLLINPTHFDEGRGIVVPLAFQEVTNRDLSVLREGYMKSADVDATIHELIGRGMERVPPQLRKVDFGCVASVAAIREIHHEGTRMFAVYDTATEEKRAHASIFTRNVVLDQKSLRAKARSDLHQVFSRTIMAVDDIKAGLTSV